MPLDRWGKGLVPPCTDINRDPCHGFIDSAQTTVDAEHMAHGRSGTIRFKGIVLFIAKSTGMKGRSVERSDCKSCIRALGDVPL